MCLTVFIIAWGKNHTHTQKKKQKKQKTQGIAKGISDWLGIITKGKIDIWQVHVQGLYEAREEINFHRVISNLDKASLAYLQS